MISITLSLLDSSMFDMIKLQCGIVGNICERKNENASCQRCQNRLMLTSEMKHERLLKKSRTRSLRSDPLTSAGEHLLVVPVSRQQLSFHLHMTELQRPDATPHQWTPCSPGAQSGAPGDPAADPCPLWSTSLPVDHRGQVRGETETWDMAAEVKLRNSAAAGNKQTERIKLQQSFISKDQQECRTVLFGSFAPTHKRRRSSKPDEFNHSHICRAQPDTNWASYPTDGSNVSSYCNTHAHENSQKQVYSVRPGPISDQWLVELLSNHRRICS